MKKGKYRFIVQRTEEVMLTITDEEQFQSDFLAWANLLGPERAGEVSELDFLRSRAHKLNKFYCCTSIEREVQNEYLHIEDIRTCRHCGCTGRPCGWAGADICDNPPCIAAEKEVQHG